MTDTKLGIILSTGVVVLIVVAFNLLLLPGASFFGIIGIALATIFILLVSGLAAFIGITIDNDDDCGCEE